MSNELSSAGNFPADERLKLKLTGIQP